MGVLLRADFYLEGKPDLYSRQLWHGERKNKQNHEIRLIFKQMSNFRHRLHVKSARNLGAEEPPKLFRERLNLDGNIAADVF